MLLRNYQDEIKQIVSVETGNLLIQGDTGSGKTRTLAAIIQDNTDVICIAHRNILIKQLSRELVKHDIAHDIIATMHTRRLCITEHRKLNKHLINGKNNVYVSSIDSLLSRHRRGLLTLDTSKNYVIIVDEAHHMVENNKWGKLAEIFPNAKFIGATATPCRLDGVSLKRGDGGLFDKLIQAPSLKQDSVRKLIELGFLSDFKCYSVPERVNSSLLKLGEHDYTYKSLEAATRTVMYEMAGDAVKHYQRLADGKQALAFCVNIEIAKETAKKFKESGIAAAAIHSKMGNVDVARVFDLFERRIIKVLCNVDMIGEGVDIPAIEVLIMLRKTASFGLYRQWCGRSLRPEQNKPHAILIDHVGNIRTHGLPDKHIDWSLSNPPQAEKSNLISCPKCQFLIKAWIDVCPECGADLSRAADVKITSNVQYIDYQLVEIERKKIDKEKQKQREAWEFENVLQIKESNTKLASGVIGEKINQLRLWFVEQCKQDLTIAQLNAFFLKSANADFWLSNFKVSDLKTKNKDKCLKVYKKCLSN
jgi:superfamily II DNA or RNA helicase